jgi:hypothetical protein
MSYKYRFVKKGKRMVATKDEEQRTTPKTHYGGLRDVSRFKAWTEVGFDKYGSTSTLQGRT